MTAKKAAPSPASIRSSPLTGQFDFLYRLYHFIDTFPAELGNAIEMVLEPARDHLRETAKTDPAWAALADKLDIVFVGDEFRYVINGSDEDFQTALNLEFGSRG